MQNDFVQLEFEQIKTTKEKKALLSQALEMQNDNLAVLKLMRRKLIERIENNRFTVKDISELGKIDAQIRSEQKKFEIDELDEIKFLLWQSQRKKRKR